MHLPAVRAFKFALLAGAVLSLSACASFGVKSPTAATAKTAANVSPTAVDADIQRILTAGGISPDDPAVAALQTPPPANGSAWEGGPTAQPPVQVTTATAVPMDPSMSVTNPGVIGVENIGETNMNVSPAAPVTTTTTAMLPDSVGIQPAMPAINPVGQPTMGGAYGNMQLPPSVMAGILPTPNFETQPVAITGPAAVEVATAAPAPRNAVAPVPKRRPTQFGTAVPVMAFAQPEPTPIAVLPIEVAVPTVAPIAPAPTTTVRRF